MAKPSINFSALLSQPLSPEQYSLAVTAGIIFGIFPVLGSTTVVCAIVAIALRLNMVVIQLVNYAVYPIQLLLIIPFMKLGSLLSPEGGFTLSLAELVAVWDHDIWAAIKQLWVAQLLAIAAWLLVALPLSIALYFGTLHIFRRLHRKAHAGVGYPD
jgi:uncharacterized protein (DUF2062 family)